MADDFDLDDFDLDGLDFDSGDEFGSVSSGGEKKNRSPVEKLGRGALEGAKQTATSPEFRRKLVKESLPDGYGEAYDGLSDTVEFGRDLYDTVAKELAPARRGFQKITKRLLPSVEKHLPKSIADKLKEFTEDTDNTNKTDWREAELDTQLGSIFETQMQHQHTLASEAEGRELAKDIITEKRFKSTIDFLDDIRQNVARQTQYQDKVLSAYQRKHLEIEYRQLFTAQDHLADFKDFKTRNIDALAAITKNTALPDSIKMRTGEMASYMLRQRLVGDLQEDMSAKLSDYLTGFKDNILKKASEFGKNIADKVGSISDAMELASDAGVDSTETIGSTVGGMLTDQVGGLIAKGARKLTGKNESIMGVGSDLEYMVQNAPTLIRERLEETSRKYGSGSYADDDFGQVKYDEDGNEIKTTFMDRVKKTSGGFFNRMLGLGADLALEVAPAFNQINDFGITQDALANEALSYNALADKAITQIIPGLLTEILHVNERIATGSDDVEKLTFNYGRDEFSRESEVKEDLMQRILPKDKLTNIRGSLQELIDVIDPNDDKLTARDRNELSKQLLVDMSSGYGFSLDRYLKPDGLDAIDDVDVRRNILTAITDRFMDEGGKVKKDIKVKEARNNVADRAKAIMRDLPNYQAEMAKSSQLYGSTFFKQTGLAKSTTSGKTEVNRKAILNFINEQESLPGVTRESLPLSKPETVSTKPTKAGKVVIGTKGVESLISQLHGVAKQTLDYLKISRVDYGADFTDIKTKVDTSNVWLEKIHAILAKWDDGKNPPPTPPGNGPNNNGPTGGGSGGNPFGQPWNPLDAGRRWLTPNPVIGQKIGELKDAAIAKASPVTNVIKQNYELYTELVQSVGHKGAIELLLDDATTDVKERTSSIKDKILNRGSLMMSDIQDLITTKNNDDVNPTPTLFSSAKSAFEEMRDKTKDKLIKFTESTKEGLGESDPMVTDKRDGITGFLADKFNKVKELGNRGISTLSEKISLPNYIKSKQEEYNRLVGVFGERTAQEMFINDVASETKGKLEDIWSVMKTTFKDNVEPRVNDVQSQLAGVYDINSERVKRTLSTAGDTLSGYKDTTFAKFNTMMDGNLAIDGTKFDSYKQTLLTEVDEIINKLKLKTDDSLDGGDIKSRLGQMFGIQPDKEADNDEEPVKLSIFERVKQKLGTAGDTLVGYKDKALTQVNAMTQGNLAIDGTKFDSYKQTLLTEVDEIINKLKLSSNSSMGGEDVKSRLGQMFGIQPDKEADNDEELMKLTILERVKQKLGTFDITAKTATLNESMLTGFESMKQWFDNVKLGGGSGDGGDGTGETPLLTNDSNMILTLENLKKEIINLTEATSNNTLAIREDADFDSVPGTPRKKRGFIANTFGRAGEAVVGAGRSALNMGVGLLKGTASLYGKGFGLLGKGIKPTFKLAKKATVGALGTGKDFVKGLFGKGDNVGDIYLEGEEEPIITKRELKKGAFFDQASMKPITSFKDIKGPVVDKDGNVVITDDDIKEKRLKNVEDKPLGAKLGGAVRSGLGMMGRFASTGYGAAFKTGKFVFDKTVNVVKKTFGFISGPRDVYVKGETTPRLLKVMMERGLYRDKESGDIINTIKDIKGPVVNTDGNVVITQEDITKGLMGPDGKHLRSILGFTKKAATLPFKLAAKAITGSFKLGRNILGGLGKGLKRAFRGIVGLPPEQVPHQTMVGVYHSNDILTQIYTLLDKRIPKPEKIRTGGWKDIFSRKKDKDDKPTEKGKGSDANKSMFKGMGKRLAGLFGMGGDDEGGGDTYIGGDADFSRDKDKDGKNKNKRKKPKGRLARMGGALKRGAMGLGRLGLGAASLGLGAAKVVGGVALGGAKVLGGLALKGLLGLGSLLSAPVVLGALAVTAVAVGGYYLYKHFKGKIDGPLHKYRIVQYGFDPKNGEHVRRISAIEEKMMEAVSFDKDTGIAKIGKLSDKALESITKICGVDIKNEAHLTPFVEWLQGRFTPIFVLHLSALRAINPKIKLNDIDSKLSKEQKVTFLDRTTLKTTDKALYNITKSPLMDEPMLVLTGASDAEKALEEALGDSKPKDSVKGPSTQATQAGMVGDLKEKKVLEGRESPLPKAPILANTPMPEIPVVRVEPANHLPGVSVGGLNAAALGVDLNNRDAEQQTEALLNERKKIEARNMATKTNADASSLRLVDSMVTVADILNVHTAIHASVDRSLKDIKDLLTDKTADVSTRDKKHKAAAEKQKERQDELLKAVRQSNENVANLKKDLAAEKRRSQQAPSGVVSLDR